jgi:hypothetical protein
MSRVLHIVALAGVLLGGAVGCAHVGSSIPASVLVDFSDPAEAGRWTTHDDRLMLGRSRGTVTAGDGFGVLEGVVQNRRGGGWWSCRRRLEPPADLSGSTALRIRLRGDGLVYGFDLRDSSGLGGTYWEAPIRTDAGEWQEVVLSLPADFEPLELGAPVVAKAPLDLTVIRSVGFVVARGQTGSFRLEVESIRADQ